MSINSIENVTRYSDELDKVFAQKSAVGFFADNALATKFVGAKKVIIPDIDFEGLTDYDREQGFARGAINVANTSYTMSMDRARSLQIDREDMDETGVANLAGKILGEYVRTKVVPECDAYVLSKLSSIALERSNVLNGDATKPFETLCNLINEVQSVVGYDEELVAFIDSYMYAALQNSAEISKMIREAIATLPPKERTVVEYRFYRNMQVKDIAKQVGLSSSRVTRIVQASLNTVKEYLNSKELYGY